MSDSVDEIRALFDEWEDDPESELYGVLLDVTEGIVKRMIEQNVRRTDLAERLGTSRAYVTKLLDGQENMTLKTLVRVANALEMKVDTKFIPREHAARPTKKATVKTDIKKKPVRPAKRAVAARTRR